MEKISQSLRDQISTRIETIQEFVGKAPYVHINGVAEGNYYLYIGNRFVLNTTDLHQINAVLGEMAIALAEAKLCWERRNK